jgi:hypothetical protein
MHTRAFWVAEWAAEVEMALAAREVRRMQRRRSRQGGGGVKVSGQPKDGRNGTFSSVLVVEISTLQPIR